MTRSSTPKYEVIHDLSGQVVKTGVSKTEAKAFARAMGKGFSVYPVKKG